MISFKSKANGRCGGNEKTSDHAELTQVVRNFLKNLNAHVLDNSIRTYTFKLVCKLSVFSIIYHKSYSSFQKCNDGKFPLTSILLY